MIIYKSKIKDSDRHKLVSEHVARITKLDYEKVFKIVNKLELTELNNEDMIYELLRKHFDYSKRCSFSCSKLNGYIGEDDKLEFICEEILENWTNNKNNLIMSDSKTVCKKIRNILVRKIDKNQIYLITSELGKLEEITNCNEEFQNKIVIFSPKIIYGVNILVKYDIIFAIYTGNTIGSLDMIQQMGRSRECKGIKVLFLENYYENKCNYHIDYSTHRELENEEFNAYVSDIQMKDFDKYTAPSELCNQIGKTSNINENAIFSEIHYYKSWFDRLFSKDKTQLVKQISREWGYEIKYENIRLPENHEKVSWMSILKKRVKS